MYLDVFLNSMLTVRTSQCLLFFFCLSIPIMILTDKEKKYFYIVALTVRFLTKRFIGEYDQTLGK